MKYGDLTTSYVFATFEPIGDSGCKETLYCVDHEQPEHPEFRASSVSELAEQKEAVCVQYPDKEIFILKETQEVIGLVDEEKDIEQCENCGRIKKSFMHNCDSSNYDEIYGCPKCDDKCAFCDMNAEPVMRFRNFYRHEECGTEWDDVWDSMCNDECPDCGAEIEPYDSEELEPEE